MTRAKIQGIAEPRFFLKMFLRQGDKHGDGRYLSSLRRLVPRDLNRIGYKTPESSDLFVVKRLTKARDKNTDISVSKNHDFGWCLHTT